MICSNALAQSTELISEWRTPAIENQVYMQTDSGLVIFELAPFIAPNHVTRFKELVSSGFYDGLDFYRVIDGFVAQAGDILGDKAKALPDKLQSPLKAEFTRIAPQNSKFQLEQKTDFSAPQTGYLNGFSAGRDPSSKEEWLLHCPGILALARNTEKHSATTDFYVVIGQSTRHLDRNMSSFGKVIFGMPTIQSLKRASVNVASGVIEREELRSQIQWVKLAKDVEPKDRINVQIQRQDSATFQQKLESARTLSNPFFHFKGNGNLDLCYHQVKTRIQD